jgi:general secretion pathway protein B
LPNTATRPAATPGRKLGDPVAPTAAAKNTTTPERATATPGAPAAQTPPTKADATTAMKPGATAPASAPASAPATASAPAKPVAAPAGVALPTIWELPFATRKDIPAIDLSMHVYSSDPKERFVVIKGERHVEGEEIGQDLMLREIRQDGLVLEYKGQIFFFPRSGR